MAIQVRRGNEVDFDPNKMLPGEWAVSLDTKYVRMCFSPGVCLRMATYEAFEADMDKIRNILTEARTIQEAVAMIQTQINDTAVVVEDYSILSKSYAVGGTGKRENEDSDNAKYYYQQTKQISQGINGIIPMGTVTFASLPTVDIVNNAMYNIRDAFTSDERFNDGGGVYYGPGNNVIYTAEGKWDVTASSAVTGIKGYNEDTYRQGNVNLTAEDIGALPVGGNAETATKAEQDGEGRNIAKTYAMNGALTAFISQINRDYYGTNGTAPVFDLMPNGTTGTVLSRLGSCYISSSEQIIEYHAPSTGYAFAFGTATDRYGIIFIGRRNNKVWFRSDDTEWIEIDPVKLAALYTRMDKFSQENGRTILASDLVSDLNDIDFNCVVNADDIEGESAYVANCPAKGWWFVQTFKHAQSNDYRKQIAYSMLNDAMYTRFCNQGTWSEWVEK